MWPFSHTELKPSLPQTGKLFVFKENSYKQAVWQRTVQLGLYSFVEKYIPESEFIILFGSYTIRKIGGEKYIGVWRVRAASRMRRILRERGASFILVNNPPGESNMGSMSNPSIKRDVLKRAP